MKVLLFLARSSRSRVLLAFVGSALGGLSSALLVALINQALAVEPGGLSWLAMAFVGLALAMPFFRWLSQTQFAVLQQSALATLRGLVSRHIAHMPYRTLEEQGAPHMLAVLVEDVGTVSEFFVALPRFVMQGSIVLGGFAYLAWLSWPALVFALSLVVLGSGIHFWAVRRASDHLERARCAEDELYDHFRALVSGAKELKLSRARREAFLSHTLLGSVEAVRTDRTRGLLSYVGTGSFGAFMFFVVIGGVIFGLGSLTELAAPVRSGYALVFLYIMFPLEDLLEAVPDLMRTRISLDRITSVCGGGLGLPDALGAAPPGLSVPSSIAQVGATFTGVGMHEVRHRYRRETEEGVFALGPLSLELKPAEVLFLVGGNGSGKTTLAKLLVGLYEPEAGALHCNGRAVDRPARAAHRQHFSAVFSDFHLFESLFGLSDAGLDTRAGALLRSLGLEGKLTIRDGKMSTTKLSSGQRKRLALLVACLEERPAYVFDEWAADQDPQYKEVFYREILPYLRQRGKAVLVITHDDRYFHLADRCLKLDHGVLSGATG